jgi:hypothetical protein
VPKSEAPGAPAPGSPGNAKIEREKVEELPGAHKRGTWGTRARVRARESDGEGGCGPRRPKARRLGHPLPVAQETHKSRERRWRNSQVPKSEAPGAPGSRFLRHGLRTYGTGIGDSAFADGPVDFALHRPAVEGCVAGFGPGFAGVVSPRGFGVEDHNVGKAANG